MQTIQADPAGLASAGSKTLASRTTGEADRLEGGRILLIDPSEKGAMPLYTGMVAEGLRAVGLRPVVLGSRYLVAPDLAISWTILRVLPIDRWPPSPGARPASALRQAATWLGCALTIMAATLVLRPKIVHFQHPIHPRLDFLLLRALARFVPVVWTAHDVLPHDPSSNAIARARRLYRVPRAVLAHSIPAAGELDRIADISALVIRHPARQLGAVPDRASARQRLDLDLDPGRRLAVAVGFIRAYKGYDLIADTWDLLGDGAPDLAPMLAPDLLILGELVDQDERATITRLQAHPRATIRLGYASDEDVLVAMAAADIVLLPHRRGSDSGSLHLARAVGTPVLSSDTPQLAAVVAATQAGRVLPRDPVLWAQALLDDLPPPPPKPPLPAASGEEHRAAYRKARRLWLAPRHEPGPGRQAG